MIWLAVIAGVTGIFLGGSVIWCLQMGNRKKDLETISEWITQIQNGTDKLQCREEDTLLSKIFHQLCRWKDMSDGYASAALKERDGIKNLVGEIAHQFRTPVTNMETYLEFLRDEGLEESERRQYLSAVEVSEQKVYFLVESFIKMSRLENHMIQIKNEEYDLMETLRRAALQAENRMKEKGLTLNFEGPESLMCIHDTNWLGEAIYNVIENAVKYSYDGGRIDIGAGQDEVFNKIWIRDYGIGIQNGEENMCFQRFYRGKNVTTQGGFGIGLYLTREIVAMQNGFVRMKKLSDGTKIEIYLKRAE